MQRIMQGNGCFDGWLDNAEAMQFWRRDAKFCVSTTVVIDTKNMIILFTTARGKVFR